MSNTPLDALHLIALPTPWAVGDVNVYLAEGDPLTLIDTGPKTDATRAALLDGLAALDTTPADIGRVIITHAHFDHYGLAAEIVAESGAEVWTHPLSVSRLADPEGSQERQTAFFAALYQEHGVPPDIAQEINATTRGSNRYADPVEVSRTLSDGDTVSLARLEWETLHTPGHAGGMLCFYQPESRVLLSSDHLIADISSNPITEPPDRPGQKRPRRLVEYMAQLERVAGLDVAVALPGHGPFITDHQALVAQRLAFHRKRADKILHTLDGGERTLYEITQPIFPKLHGLDMFLALSEVLGHVDLLEQEKRIERVERDGVTYWRRVSR